MKFVFIILMLLMILFMAVQINDPDGLMWVVVYAIPAFWCGLASFLPARFFEIWVRLALMVCIIIALAGVVWFWPLTPRFWTKDVWYNVETAREGLGLMIVVVVLMQVLVFRCFKVSHELPKR